MARDCGCGKGKKCHTHTKLTGGCSTCGGKQGGVARGFSSTQLDNQIQIEAGLCAASGDDNNIHCQNYYRLRKSQSNYTPSEDAIKAYTPQPTSGNQIEFDPSLLGMSKKRRKRGGVGNYNPEVESGGLTEHYGNLAEKLVVNNFRLAELKAWREKQQAGKPTIQWGRRTWWKKQEFPPLWHPTDLDKDTAEILQWPWEVLGEFPDGSFKLYTPEIGELGADSWYIETDAKNELAQAWRIFGSPEKMAQLEAEAKAKQAVADKGAALQNMKDLEVRRSQEEQGFKQTYKADPNYLKFLYLVSPENYATQIKTITQNIGSSQEDVERAMNMASFLTKDALSFYLSNQDFDGNRISPVAVYIGLQENNPDLFNTYRTSSYLSNDEAMAKLQTAIQEERGVKEYQAKSGSGRKRRKRGGVVNIPNLNIDWQGQAEQAQQTLINAGTQLKNINFNPETNGVNDAFRQFGVNTQQAFNAIGNEILDVVKGNKDAEFLKGLEQAQQYVYENVGTIDNWLTEKLNDPETLITVIGITASVAATILSAGTTGPLTIVALNALEPGLTILNSLAQGEPVDPLAVVAFVSAIAPGITNLDEFGQLIKDGVDYALTAGIIYQSGLIGQVLASATSTAGMAQERILSIREKFKAPYTGDYGTLAKSLLSKLKPSESTCSEETLASIILPNIQYGSNPYNRTEQGILDVVCGILISKGCGVNMDALTEYLAPIGLKPTTGTPTPGLTLRSVPLVDTLTSTGSGKKRNSRRSTQMSGTGANDSDYLAYIGIDDSYVGSGKTHSWESWYDESQHKIHQHKMDLVRRRVEQRTVKIKPYSQRPELLSDTFKEGPYGRAITGQVAGGAKKGKVVDNPALPPEMDTTPKKAEAVVSRFHKAALQAKKKVLKGGALKGGDWFKPSTWTWESVNPTNWSTEDWKNLAKGADAAIFGTLSDPTVLHTLQGTLVAGGSVTLPPPIGTVSGEALAAILQGAVMAHEYLYPSCEKGEGALGCNEYRKDVEDVVKAAVDIYNAYETGSTALDNLSDFLTRGIGADFAPEPGDIMGQGKKKRKMKGGDVSQQPNAENKVDFFYPSFSGREARGQLMSTQASTMVIPTQGISLGALDMF